MNERIVPALRCANKNDVSLLARFARRTFHEAFGAMVPEESMTSYLADSFNEERVAAELEDTNSVFILAEIDGSPAGYAKLFFCPPIPGVVGPDSVKLWRLYTAAEWQGTGIGKVLMNEAVRIAKERGGKTLWLTVNVGNAKAIAFYERYGFLKTGKTGFLLGGVPQEDHIMEYTIPV